MFSMRTAWRVGSWNLQHVLAVENHSHILWLPLKQSLTRASLEEDNRLGREFLSSAKNCECYLIRRSLQAMTMAVRACLSVYFTQAMRGPLMPRTSSCNAASAGSGSTACACSCARRQTCPTNGCATCALERASRSKRRCLRLQACRRTSLLWATWQPSTRISTRARARLTL